ncbi:MBL fold metallo-hydrolase [Marinicella sp. S1101]|uniref:MBL fold metallo-hydrolase n=1 Tax=Marinicella marina TaxID=2996016 RepID=UPI002260C95D|nr:MBL fold metallo-hydrolase [Marinicella marina]MCX7553022.1 MBL fold metallo-hydrolase [Marinicella marina]MDJ1139668.1 MBL fold metallo-hydrolase [Marinicella marina]
MKLYSIEGNRQKLDAGAMFGNVPKALWSRWVEVDELNRMELACRALLVEDLNGKNVLFETGIGNFFEPKLKQRFGVYENNHVLIDSLAEIGFKPEDIDVVVLSHLHFDHAGGMLTAWDENKQPELVFKNAEYLIGSDHWQRAINPHPRDRASFIPILHDLLQLSGRLRLVSGTTHETLGPDVIFSYTNGHTPGLMHAQVGDLIFATDLIPGSAWVHIPISMGYDRFPELLIDEKTSFLNNVVKHNWRLFFTHDPDFSVANVIENTGRYEVSSPIKQLQEEIL